MDLTGYADGTLALVADRLAARHARDPVDARTADPIAVLVGRPLAEARALIAAVRAERARRVPSPELVWTGPAPVGAVRHRDTAIVLQRLFASARERVVLAGYSFDHGRELLATLHAAMAERGVAARLFVNIEVDRAVMSAPAPAQVAWCQAEVARLLRENWPFGAPWPEVFYDTRPLETGRFSSMHAKCVVIDDRVALVTSANFTRRGQVENIEVGALIHDPAFVAALAAQWANAVRHGLFARWSDGRSAD